MNVSFHCLVISFVFVNNLFASRLTNFRLNILQHRIRGNSTKELVSILKSYFHRSSTYDDTFWKTIESDMKNDSLKTVR